MIATDREREREVNYHVRINNVRDLELFANYIKDALVDRVASERFSTVRLKGAPLVYNDFLHGSLRGRAHYDGTLEVAQREDALQLAGTVIHEMAHMLVGNHQQHNDNWIEGASFLGLRIALIAGQAYAPEHFDHAALAVVREAIARFAREHPELVYDPNMLIPWPSGVGLWTCPSFDPASGNHCPTHWLHVLKFQDEDIREMLARSRGILNANDMGLGKTLEACGYINATNPDTILVVCPNNAKLIWKWHFDRLLTRKYDYEVAYTNLYIGADVVIMNYEAAVKWKAQLQKAHWSLVIYDEGHKLKNPSAQRSKACFSIHGDKAMIITGSPMPNYPIELFPLGHYLIPEHPYFREVRTFEMQFGSKTKERFGRNLNRLNAALRESCMTRRLKKDVLPELPRKRRQLVEFEVSPEVRKLIDDEKRLWNETMTPSMVHWLNAMRNESDTAEDDFDWASIIEELKATKRYAFEELSRMAHLIGLAKLPFALEHLENALESREKVMCFGYHRAVLQKIADHFKPHSLLYMGSSNESALDLSIKFNETEDLHLWVAQIKLAEAYSIRSSVAIFVEQSWGPGEFEQSENRGHGLGRGEEGAKSMLIHHLTFEDSLDTKKAQMCIRKQKAIDRAIGGSR